MGPRGVFEDAVKGNLLAERYFNAGKSLITLAAAPQNLALCPAGIATRFLSQTYAEGAGSMAANLACWIGLPAQMA